MKLANYINDLLYRYDCVIVPNFGGFITNKISATLNESSHTFYPPTKQIGFNANLKHNDGLLANYIAAVENFSFEKANNFIDKEVFAWLTALENNSIEIASIGQMSLNAEKQLVFEPDTTTNFLTSSFGLTSVEASVKEAYKEKVIPLHTTIVEDEEETQKRGVSSIVKVAAAAAILLTLGLGYQQYNNRLVEKNQLAEQQQNIEKKIQEATFVIDNPLPTINLNVTKVKAASKDYHVIAGAFQLLENATKKVNQLERKGFNAFILGKNRWGLTQVAFDSYETKKEARETLQDVKKSGYKDAWLLVKKFD